MHTLMIWCFCTFIHQEEEDFEEVPIKVNWCYCKITFYILYELIKTTICLEPKYFMKYDDTQVFFFFQTKQFIVDVLFKTLYIIYALLNYFGIFLVFCWRWFSLLNSFKIPDIAHFYYLEKPICLGDPCMF